MAALLRSIGLVLAALWAAMLLLGEKIDHPILAHANTVLIAGLAALAAGIALGFLGRARGAVLRRRCVRCHRAVSPGEVYCTEHFRDTVNQARDTQER